MNSYGSAVRSGILNAESADSDGQGDANIVEINANAQPAWTVSAPAGVSGDLDPVDVVVNDPPTADSAGPYTASVGEPINFDGSGSSDPDGSIVSYLWTFGDGASASTESPTHTYTAAGTYPVTLTVTDDDNARDSASTSATIIAVDTSTPPIADAGGPYSGTVDNPVTFNGTGSTDPDGGAIVRYDWNFGDGSATLADAGATPSHVYTATGSYTVILTVTDDEGVTDSDTATASIGTGDLPPIADAGGPYTADIGETVTFDATGSTDPDGNIVSYDWEFGDGTVLIDAGATPNHTYSTAGTFNVILTVWDEVNLSDTDATQATITDPLDAPTTPPDEGDEEDRDDEDRDDEERDDEDRDDEEWDDEDRDDDDREDHERD
ncbi:MAG: PKD domain-containing protein [Gammaproteobacteria bacterium]|nr:PKD domain-containing protein [Gammaproteobacteria bacterium]